MILPWILCGILFMAVILLIVKIFLLKKSMNEICTEFTERLAQDTNTLISVSSRDKHVRMFASEINIQLRRLRKERQKYQKGDRELKDAVTNISHDLRTPLTAICGYLDLLEHKEQSLEVSKYLGQIKNRTEALKQLTEELFRYSVITTVRSEVMEPVSLNRALEDSLLSYYGAFTEKGIHPKISLPEISVQRLLDASALTRIFDNILSNALKYSDGPLEVWLTEDGKITFTNTAKAMTPVMAGRLFDRFYTVETGRNSTGLGLSIAKLLTERMGGSISAEYSHGELKIVLIFSVTSG